MNKNVEVAFPNELLEFLLQDIPINAAPCTRDTLMHLRLCPVLDGTQEL